MLSAWVWWRRSNVLFLFFLVKSPEMTGEPQGDGYTLGLLLELRKPCQRIAGDNEAYAYEAHRLLQQLSNPNLHGLDRDLSFRVIQMSAENAPVRDSPFGPACTARNKWDPIGSRRPGHLHLVGDALIEATRGFGLEQLRRAIFMLAKATSD